MRTTSRRRRLQAEAKAASAAARCVRFLYGALARLDRRGLPPSEWLRSGWPRLIPLLMLAALPVAAAGPIRAATGVSMNAAFTLGVGLLAAVVAPFLPSLLVRDRAPIVSHAVALVLGLFGPWLLYTADFDGLANNWGGDGGSHVWNCQQFIERSDTYYGFVSLYGIWDRIVRAGGDFILAVKVTFVFELFAIGVAPCIVAFAVLRKFTEDRRAYFIGLLVVLAGGLAIRYLGFMPAESFHHMGGFWAHVFALVPLVALWWVDALVRHQVLRLAGIVLVLAIYRYSYGLNLPEGLAAVSVVFLAEASGRAVPTALRVALALACAATAYASYHAYTALEPQFENGGWIVRHDVDMVARGQLIGIFALAFTVVAWPARAAARGSGIVRALRFPLLFGGFSFGFQRIIAAIPPKQFYYFEKQSFHAVVLVACGLVVVLTFWAAMAARFQRRALVGLVVALILVLASQREVRRGFAPFREGFNEQVFGGPYAVLGPLYDKEVLADIQQALAEEKKPFGGYLSRHFPRYSFTNALYNLGGVDFWFHSRPRPAAGKCLFWEGVGSYPRLDELAQKKCVTYPGKWSPQGIARRLCRICL